MTGRVERVPIFLEKPKDKAPRIRNCDVNDAVVFHNAPDFSESCFRISEMLQNVAESHYIEKSVAKLCFLQSSLTHIQTEASSLFDPRLAWLNAVRFPTPLFQPIKMGATAAAHVENFSLPVIQ